MFKLTKLNKQFDILLLSISLLLIIIDDVMLNFVGNKPSATVQPFLLLHLDILPDAVHTIEDALHLFSASETLEGYRVSAGKVLGLYFNVIYDAPGEMLCFFCLGYNLGNSDTSVEERPVHFLCVN